MERVFKYFVGIEKNISVNVRKFDVLFPFRTLLDFFIWGGGWGVRTKSKQEHAQPGPFNMWSTGNPNSVALY